MIRFFGIILGFVLVVNIAVTALNSDYSFSSITASGKEVIRKIAKTIQNFNTQSTLADNDENTFDNTHKMAIQNDIIQGETVSEKVKQVIEQPTEVRIFWGPFRSQGGASGFAKIAESIGGLPTEIIKKNVDQLYIAFVGKPDAIDLAITTFIDQTGINIKKNYVL